MKILVLGGTRFFGIPMIQALLNYGHDITIATRGNQKDPFGNRVTRIIADRQNQEDLKKIFKNKHYDLVIDKIAYASNDIKRLLDVISCDRYMLTSTTAVYEFMQDFNPFHDNFLYVNRNDDVYRVTKRYAECALIQDYPQIPCVIVRYPFVVGLDDYTKRISFYIDHILTETSMFIDNLDTPLHFIDSQEAGQFMAYLAHENVTGIYDGASVGEITPRQLIKLIENITNKKAILDACGEKAPYNQTPYFKVDTSPASKLGFYFSDLSDWMELLIKQLIVSKNNDQYKINENNYLNMTHLHNSVWIQTLQYENEALLDLLLSSLNEDYPTAMIPLEASDPLLALLLSKNYVMVGGYTQNQTYYHILSKQN